MSLNSVLRRFCDAVAGLGLSGTTIRHYWRANLTPPFLIWAETGDGDARWLDNKLGHRNVGGVLDYFTKMEFDPNVDKIETMFSDFGCSWYLDTVDYEEETNMIHYSWIWSVGT